MWNWTRNNKLEIINCTRFAILSAIIHKNLSWNPDSSHSCRQICSSHSSCSSFNRLPRLLPTSVWCTNHPTFIVLMLLMLCFKCISDAYNVSKNPLNDNFQPEMQAINKQTIKQTKTAHHHCLVIVENVSCLLSLESKRYGIPCDFESFHWNFVRKNLPNDCEIVWKFWWWDGNIKSCHVNHSCIHVGCLMANAYTQPFLCVWECFFFFSNCNNL